eukprot:m.178760 g.178760  ORF g.178760 m.178760 type:complete len:381 (-) comp31953_c2_seq5:83-1225(-)
MSIPSSSSFVYLPLGLPGASSSLSCPQVLFFVFVVIMCFCAEVSQGSCICQYGCNNACPGCCIPGLDNNQCYNPQGCCNYAANANANVTATTRVQTKHQRKRDSFCPTYGTTTPAKTTYRATTTPARATTTPAKKTTTPVWRTTTPGKTTSNTTVAPFTPDPTKCQPADYAWLYRGHQSGADAWYINLSPHGNFGNSYEDCSDKMNHGTTTNTFAKVRIALGNVLGSTFVVVDGTDATYREGAYHVSCPITYPAWGQADGCDSSNPSMVSINLTDTPFSLAFGNTAFKTFDEYVVNSYIQIQCSSGSSNSNQVCSGACGGNCGGCSAGPHGSVLLQVTDQRAFDCGILAHSNTNYVCKNSMCVPGPSNFNFSTCESLCQT